MHVSPMLICRLQDGWTPLILASEEGQEAVVKVLLAAGCDKEAKSNVSRGLLTC